MRAESELSAMGTTAHVVVYGGGAPELVAVAERRLVELEARWSRFRPDSELSWLNDHPGEPALVSADTVELVSHAVAAWEATGGRFDPTVEPALVANGYDRTFSDLATRPAGVGSPIPLPAPGCSGIWWDRMSGLVSLPVGVRLDPGGIGKGLAADLVSAELIEQGATGVLVNLGGDLRVRGEGPDDGHWPVSIEHPDRPGAELVRLAIDGGAVATSSTRRRRWRQGAETRHHLLDPSTGRPTTGPVIGVTVIAGEAWWAEALTKSLLLEPDPRLAADLLTGASAVLVDADGRVDTTVDLEGCIR